VFTIRADDQKGGVSEGDIAISIGPPPPIVTPPQVVTYQSGETAAAGESIVLRTGVVNANDGFTFAWSCPVGTLGAPTNTATSSEIVWVAPAGFSDQAKITATVAGAQGITSVASFLVSRCPASEPYLDPVTGQCAACPAGEVLHAGKCATFVGSYSINYLYNAAGCCPSGQPSDGNPYQCVYESPIRFPAVAGTYVIDITAIGPDGAANADVWSGDATTGTRTSIPGTPGESVSFTHAAGEISLYAWDWYPWDNPSTMSTQVDVYRVDQ
jgi:hypothetical protein